MPKSTSSFQYVLNNLPLNQYAYDYYNALVARYQDVRTAYVNQHGVLDDIQTAKVRYTDTPIFISHNNVSATTMLFANRANGYMAYTDTLDKSKEDPLYLYTLETVEDFPEYLSRVHNTPDQGFFYYNDTLCCYAKITSNDVLVSTNKGTVSLLFFCESFNYNENKDTTTGRIGQAVLTSSYFTNRTIDIYTDDSIGTLEKYTVYAKISSNDPHPTEKIPGEPIYKTLVITQMGSEVTKINIDGLEIDTTADLNRVIKAFDNRFNENYVGLKYTGNGNVELGFCLQYRDYPITEITLPVKLFINGAWGEEKTCTIYFKNNHIQGLYPTIKIDDMDKYLDVPTAYTLRVENRYFLSNPSTRKTTEMFYLDITNDVPIHYKGVVNTRYVYETDSITVSVEKGKLPGEYGFKITDTYSKVNGFDIPVWVYGYTSGEIRPIPADYIVITPKINAELTYTEYGTSTYTVEFPYEGNLTLVEVGLKTVADDYQYFSSSDFTFTKVSETTGKMVYSLGLSKKIFIDPQEVTRVPLRIVFKYIVKRIDASQLNWRGETINTTMTITYVENRWTLENVTLDNALLGDAVVTYKLKDNLLNAYTDKFAMDLRLVPVGKTLYENYATKIFDSSDWDNRNKIWIDNINITEFGDIRFQFQGVVAHSTIYTIPHTEPTHPLVVTPHPKTINLNTSSRILIDLKYKEKITGIYVNGTYLSKGTPIKLDNVKDGYGLMFPIYTADKSEIVGMAIDIIPVEEKDISVNLVFTNVNEYDYSNWTVTSAFTVPVKQTDFNFTFTLTDFAFGRDSSGTLALNDTLLTQAQITATVLNAANNVLVARPNFNGIGGGNFTTTNLFIDDYLSSQKNYILTLNIYEYVEAAKNNTLPNTVYYYDEIPFTVP